MVLITSHKARIFLYQAAFVVQMKLVSVRNQAEFCKKNCHQKTLVKNYSKCDMRLTMSLLYIVPNKEIEQNLRNLKE